MDLRFLTRTWTGRISLLCLGVFLIAWASPSAAMFLQTWGAADNRILQGEVWRTVSYGFIHFEPMHILFNLIAFISFGLALERTLPTYRFLGTVLWGIVFGALGHLTQLAVFHSSIGAVGLSAGVCSVLTFWAMDNPNRTILLYFFPIRAKAALWVFVGISALCLVTGMQSTVGHGAHLAGMLAGYMCFKGWIVR